MLCFYEENPWRKDSSMHRLNIGPGFKTASLPSEYGGESAVEQRSTALRWQKLCPSLFLLPAFQSVNKTNDVKSMIFGSVKHL